MKLADQQRGIDYTDFQIDGLDRVRRGKVRDSYFVGQEGILMVATDRISAFDHVLPCVIPYKGEILNQLAAKAFEQTEHIVRNWLFDLPDPTASMGWRCEPLPIEFVVRGYLCGHAARVYETGARTLCGHKLPEGLRRNDPLPQPILTPTTKAQSGHDEDISREAIIERGIITADRFDQLQHLALALFEVGQKQAQRRGLILADTKYEFGLRGAEILLIDEVHTPDSSRYFYADGFEERQERGRKQQQLSKEFVREWLTEQGFQGQEGQYMPSMSDETVASIQERYFALYRIMTGEVFRPSDRSNWRERLIHNIREALEKWQTYA